jgi:hypothetical protein
LTDEISKIHDGIGDKLGLGIEIISTLIGSIIVGKSFMSE